MNKITSTLVGVAMMATASVVPAFAQGSFTNMVGSPLTFSFAPAGSFSVIDQPVTYNPFGGGASIDGGTLTLTGGTEVGTSAVYTNVSLSYVNGALTILDTVPFATVVPISGSTYSLASVGRTAANDSFNLTGAPVPEASTVVSFGALLALGGLAVLRRKTVKA